MKNEEFIEKAVKARRVDNDYLRCNDSAKRIAGSDDWGWCLHVIVCDPAIGKGGTKTRIRLIGVDLSLPSELREDDCFAFVDRCSAKAGDLIKELLVALEKEKDIFG